MKLTLLLHILAGALGLVSGYVALAASKGGTLHRKGGMFFVYVMTTSAVTGMLISAAGGVAPAINIPLGLLTFYLVMTSLLTVRPPAQQSRWLNTAGMVMAFAIGLSSVVLSLRALGQGGAAAGLAFVLLPFGGVAIAAGVGDRRIIMSGPLLGAPRLKRHLWRMCFAFFIASIAFYGAGRVPEVIRSPALNAVGVLLPLAAMGYWVFRLRVKRSLSNGVPLRSPQAPLFEATK